MICFVKNNTCNCVVLKCSTLCCFRKFESVEMLNVREFEAAYTGGLIELMGFGNYEMMNVRGLLKYAIYQFSRQTNFDFRNYTNLNL